MTGVPGSLQAAVPVVSVVLVSWNTCSLLRECLRSLYAHSTVSFEVVVVDNGSSDGTAAMVQAEFPNVRLLRNASNAGFARACNQGMHAARGRYLLLLNSDTYLADDAVGRMVLLLEARPEIALAGCQARFPDGRIQHTAFRSLSILRSLFEDLFLYKLLPHSFAAGFLLGGHFDCDIEIEVDWLAGVFVMLRSAVFHRDGGFSEDFFMYGEDSEWCTRLRRQGHRVLFSPAACVYHHGAASSDQSWSERQRLRLCHLGGFAAYAKSSGRTRGFLYVLAQLTGSVFRIAAHTLLSLLRTSSSDGPERRLHRQRLTVCWEALTRGWDPRRWAHG